MSGRPSKEDMYMEMAMIASKRSSCLRAKVGAVITDKQMRNVLAIGYNGPPRKVQNGCADDPKAAGNCGCLHAELNAIMKAPFEEEDLHLFVTMSPCVMCARAILNTNVVRVVYLDEYRNAAGLQLLRACGISVVKI